MDSNIDFRKLWSQRSTEAPDLSVVLDQVKQLKRKYMKRLVVTNACLILTSIFVVFIWIYYQPEYITTKIGIVLVVSAMISYLIAYNQLYPILQKNIASISNQKYLMDLLQMQKRQKFMHTTMTSIYFALLGVGLGLYMFEYTYRMSVPVALVVYGATGAWILFNWFFFRPRMIKKQQAELDQLILRVESLINQMKE